MCEGQRELEDAKTLVCNFCGHRENVHSERARPKANVCTLREVRPDYWELDFTGNCGNMAFESVIKVVEARSKNPGILVDKPFGLRGMKHAIQAIEQARAKYGLTTME